MKRGYYIHFNGRKSIGVYKKIDMQIQELRRYFDLEEIEIIDIDRNLIQRLIGLLPSCSIKRNYDEAMNKIERPDFVYIRRTVADNEYIIFLREIKRRFPFCKIIIEIFTYPYDRDEFLRWNAWPFYIKEIKNRRKLKRYVDRFVTHSKEKVIFGVPTIHASNGIIVRNVEPVSGETKKEDDTLTLMAVAYMQKHHGYERVIKGINQYIKKGGKRQIKLYLVGDGPEKTRYIRLVNKLKLDKQVLFFATMTGKALDKLYDEADIAVGAFGFFKDHVYFVSTIKVKEYLAKGIPIINGCKEETFEHNNVSYYMEFPNDSTDLNIEAVIRFYDNIYKNKSKKQVIDEIRKYATETVDMSIAIFPVVEYIQNN